MNEIISNINNKIASVIGANVALFGLSQAVVVIGNDGEVKYPAIVTLDGECTYVFLDDKYKFGGYHRLLNKTFSKVAGQGRRDVDLATYEMLFVAWGFRSKLQIDEISLEEKLLAAFPVKADLVQTNYDKQSIFNSEFKGFDYNVNPDEILMSIKYKVQVRIKRSCLEID